MENFSWQEPFGIQLLDWGITAGLITLSILGAKVIFWLLSKVISKLAKKTKSQLDDLLCPISPNCNQLRDFQIPIEPKM